RRRFQAGLKAGEREFKGFGDRLDSIGGKASRAGQALTIGLTVPIIGVGTAASKLSMSFDTSLSRIVGLAGQTRKQVAAWREDLLKLGPVLGKTPQELAEALYFIASSGIAGSQALDVLTKSAQASAAGMGATQTIANALTSAINAYGAANLDAGTATGILVATVREGKAEADDLAGSIGRVIPLASKLSVSFDQVGAALAAMTQLGLDTDEATTALRGIFTALINPTTQGADALEHFGLSYAGLRKELRDKGLLSVLRTLNQAFGGNIEAMQAVFPEVRGLTGVLSLMGANADTVNRIFQNLAAAGLKDLETAFGAAAETDGFKWNQTMAKMQASLIKFGDTISPVIAGQVLPILDHLIMGVDKAASAFSRLPSGLQTGIVAMALLVAAIGPLLLILGGLASGISAIIAIAPLMGAAIAVATGPIGLTIIAIAALIAAVYLLWKNWDTIWPALKASPAAFADWFKGGGWKEIVVGVFAGLPGLIIKHWDAIWDHLPNPVRAAMNTVSDIVESAINFIIAQLNRVIDGINKVIDTANKAPNWLTGGDIPTIPPIPAANIPQGDLRRNTNLDPFSAVIRGIADAINKVKSSAAGATPSLDEGAGAWDGAADSAENAAEKIDIWADGIIDLGEAIANNLNPAQAAYLELVHDAETGVWALRDAEFRLEVEREKAARGTDILKVGLINIAAELIRSGRTAAQFRLDEWLRPAFDSVKSMIEEIFSQPTREGLELDKKLHELRRKALLLERRGADASADPKKMSAADRELKRVNDQIEALQREIDIRREEFAIIKDETLLKDQTLATDKDILNANQFLATALGSLSGEVKSVSDALGIRLFDAALKAASGLSAVGAAGGTGFTAAEKHWINGVAASRGEPAPFP
ncbi:MAG TPA: phage tail tape measure protein, partial [Methyloceanibacter sp.]|nr:phage tail tape measure protein [Methyloceanibacter sp.]